MKNTFLVLLFILSLFPLNTFAFDTSVKGFIALDGLNFQKIQNKKGSAIIGIAVLDLKIFAEQENVTAAMKLDLDGKLADELAIIEEAYASYRGVPNFKFTLGRSVVKFQNLHWGASMNTYQDGGSILGTENSYRKVFRKSLFSIAYGQRRMGFIDTFTIWGDSNEIDYDDQGTPKKSTYNGKASYSYRAEPAFNTDKQFGLGNKFELYKISDWTFNFSQLGYRNKEQDRVSWALDFGANYESTEYELWFDSVYGFTTKSPYEKYTTYRKYEYFMQLGGEKMLTDKWSIVGNTEWLYVRDQRSLTADAANQDGSLIQSTSMKLESVFKYKLSKSSFTTMGAMYERKIASKNGVKDLPYIAGVYNANADAYKLAVSFAFWF